MIHPVLDVKLQPLPASEGEVVYSEVWIKELKSKTTITGSILEAAFSFGDQYIILFVTNDIIYEESLHVYLLDFDLHQVLDSAVIGGMYSTGLFENEKVVGEDTVFFSFMANHDWMLKVLKKPELVSPLSFATPQFVKRPFSMKRYFRITVAIS